MADNQDNIEKTVVSPDGLYERWLASKGQKPSLHSKFWSLAILLGVISALLLPATGFSAFYAYMVSGFLLVWMFAYSFIRAISFFFSGVFIFHPLLIVGEGGKWIVLRVLWALLAVLCFLPLLLANDIYSSFLLLILMDLFLAFTWASAQLNHARLHGDVERAEGKRASDSSYYLASGAGLQSSAGTGPSCSSISDSGGFCD